jgi:hypothetical protein
MNRSIDDFSTIVFVAISIPENLDIRFVDHARGALQQAQRACNGQSVSTLLAADEPSLDEPIDGYLVVAPRATHGSHKLEFGSIDVDRRQDPLETCERSTGNELGELRTQQCDIHCAATHQNTAVSHVGEPFLPSIDSDSEEWSTRDVERVNIEPPDITRAAKRSVQCSALLTIAPDTVQRTIWADTDDDDPAVGVRECHRRLLNPINRDALLELDVVILARKCRTKFGLQPRQSWGINGSSMKWRIWHL